jgi:hypothetical protein
MKMNFESLEFKSQKCLKKVRLLSLSTHLFLMIFSMTKNYLFHVQRSLSSFFCSQNLTLPSNNTLTSKTLDCKEILNFMCFSHPSRLIYMHSSSFNSTASSYSIERLHVPRPRLFELACLR